MTKISLTIVLLSAFLLSGCVRKMDVPQGNIITPHAVQTLHIGMTRTQVIDTMGGKPILLNTFRDNQLNYVYTFKPGGGNMTEQSITLTFERGRLVKIDK